MPPDLADLPIGHAAYEVVDLERSAPLQGTFDIELGELFVEPSLRAHFARREYTGPIRLYRISDVTLDASLMLLLRSRSRITETRHHVTDEEYAAALVKPMMAATHDPANHYVICCNRTWQNYYHWLIQTVPAIDWSLQTDYHRNRTLVLWPLYPWQEATLKLLGCEDADRLTLDISDAHNFPSAEFSDFLGAGMPDMVSLSAMATFRRLSGRVPWTRDAAEVIYVARTDSRNRVMENEAELIALLERRGVRIVVPGALSFEEQIATFRAARLVIGPHGPGLSNIVFCQAGACVYEMLPRHYPNVVYNRLAQSAELHYWADLFEGVGEGFVHDRTWRVDLEVVAARLNAILARLASIPRVEPAMDFLKRTQVAHPDDLEGPVGAPRPQPQLAVEPQPRAAAEPELAESEPPAPGLFARIGRLFVRGGS